MYNSGFVFRVAAFFTVGVALSLSGGCGGGGGAAGQPDTAAVSGKVMHNGSPVAGVSVSFTATGGAPRAAIGETNDKGEFTLTTFNTDDGAVVGEHTVTISKAVLNPDLEKMDAGGYAKSMEKSNDRRVIPGGSAEEVKGLLPAKYADPVESGLSRTVVAGEENVFNFDLKD